MTPGRTLLPSVLFNRLVSRGKIKQLQLVVALARLGTLQKAAPTAGMSQPAATNALSDLEAMLGMPLFERHARGMRVTPAGEEILQAALRVIDAVQAGTDAIAVRRNGALGTVRVGAIAAAVSSLLRQQLPSFCAAHPDILVDVQELNAERLEVARTEAAVDLMLCRQPEQLPSGLSFAPLCDDEFIVVARSSHPFAERENVRVKDLAQETWLSLPTSAPASPLFDVFADEAGGTVRCRLVTTRSINVIVSMLQSEDLLCVVPRTLVGHHIADGSLTVITLGRHDPFTPLGVMWADSKLGQASQLLLSHFIKNRKERS